MGILWAQYNRSVGVNIQFELEGLSIADCIGAMLYDIFPNFKH